jgi:hypothetical protein
MDEPAKNLTEGMKEMQELQKATEPKCSRRK